MTKKPTGNPPGRPKTFCEKQALMAAMEVFAQKGFEGASTSDLVAAMGISRPSMYDTYGNKEQLYIRAMGVFNDLRKAGVEETLNAQPARESITQLLRNCVSNFTDQAHGVCFVTQAPLPAGAVSEATRDLSARRRAEVEEAIMHRLKRAIRDGELSASTSAAKLAAYYAVIIQGIALQAQHGGTADQLLQVVDVAMENWPGH
ncbi:TetR/AcrR family transcriptional regulator [Acidisphaera sp. L21]|uniref:TetR/AcrR family transcriptional regulator n=1 Tax=Acidisphaera sp. L21 TaxID=1641851 RepID=UPI00131DD0EB|nr:TetR/AcrR family transcriptional regulator [Acidisphaera sp. L21]